MVAIRAVAIALLASASLAAGHPDEAALINETKEILAGLKDFGALAKSRFANASEFDERLERIVHREIKARKNNISEAAEAFRAAGKRANGKAQEVLNISDPNQTAHAKELLSEAEAALEDMHAASKAVKHLMKETREAVHDGLKSKLKVEEAAAKQLKEKVSQVQHQAHKTMDPLYGMGDAAEDQADALNDNINDAEDDAKKALKRVTKPYFDDVKKTAKESEKKLEHLADEGEDNREDAEKMLKKLVKRAAHHLEDLAGDSDDAFSSSLVLDATPEGAAAAFAAGAGATFALVAAVMGAVRLAGSRRQRSDIESPLLV